MNKNLELQTKALLENFDEIEEQLEDTQIISDFKKVNELNQTRTKMLPLITKIKEYHSIEKEILEISSQLTQEEEQELKEFIMEEKNSLESKLKLLEKEILFLLLPKEESEGKNIFLEIRAGTGGEEAALFARDLFKMYTKYLESKAIQFELVHIHSTGLEGIKEAILLIKGKDAYRLFHLEGGIHRVQRIPETESGGRIHTSACTMAVIPEVQEEELVIDPKDIRVDVFRSSGPGGQSVNTTDSAVRITHIPSGLVVSCQDEKSQHKNRSKALSILRARLKDKDISEQHKEQSAQKKAQIGSGDRSEKIRTYNYPQNRVTDHRINYTLHNLDRIMQGELNELIEKLLLHEKETKLKSLINTND